MTHIILVQASCRSVTWTCGVFLLNNSLPSPDVVRNDENDGELKASKNGKEAVRPFFVSYTCWQEIRTAYTEDNVQTMFPFLSLNKDYFVQNATVSHYIITFLWPIWSNIDDDLIFANKKLNALFSIL